MKFAGRDVPKPRHRLGTKVHVKAYKKDNVGKIVKDTYEFHTKSWKYRVKMENGTSKWWPEKSLRKVRRVRSK